MKIAIFTDAFPPQVNGVVTHLIDTVNLLGQHHEVFIFAPKPEKKIRLRELAAKQIFYLPSAPLNFYKHLRITLPLYPHLTIKLARLKPDIIHFHTPSTVGANAVILGKILKIPVVGTFHTYFMEPEYLRILGLDKFYIDRMKFINRTLWGYARLFYNNADIVISPSLYTKKDLIKHGIKKPIEIISNGISNNLYSPPLSPIKKLSLPKNFFLYVGRISKEKSLDIVIRAFARFVKQNSDIDINLVLVGDGPAKNKLEKLAFHEGVNKKIYFLGEINHAQLTRSNIYKNAIAFTTASTSEIQPMSILEAIKFGLPIIAVSARGLIELVKKNGLLTPPHNIERLAESFAQAAQDEKQRKLWSQQSQKLAHEHSIEKTVTKLENVYLHLKNEKKTSDWFSS